MNWGEVRGGGRPSRLRGMGLLGPEAGGGAGGLVSSVGIRLYMPYTIVYICQIWQNGDCGVGFGAEIAKSLLDGGV